MAPSAIGFSDDSDTPAELDAAGIAKVIADFKAAAVRALQAGFKLIEIHGAHGYLIHEFLSLLTNKRTDEYGGSFENRIRLLQQIIAAIRSVWPEGYPLLLRISASDWTEGGWTVDDSVRLAETLKGNGVDMIDCSTGGIVSGVKIPAKPGYQVPFAEAVRKTGMPSAAVGIITTATQAEKILINGQADLIVMAREMLRDPYFPLHAAKELGYDIPWPIQYERDKR